GGSRIAGLIVPRARERAEAEPPLARPPARDVALAIDRLLVDGGTITIKGPWSPIAIRDARARAGPLSLGRDGQIANVPIETSFAVADVASSVLVAGSVASDPSGVRLRA